MLTTSPTRLIRSLFIGLVLLTGLALSACGDDSPTQDGVYIGGDTGSPDAGGDADAEADTGWQPPELTCTEPSAHTAAEPTEVELDRWVVASSGNGTNAQLEAAIFDGTFSVPGAGSTEYGVSWLSSAIQDNGQISPRGLSGIVYAATTIEVEEDTVVFARADDANRVYVNDQLQTGDVYGHGDKRVPLALEAGENEVVILFSARSTPQVEIFTSPDALYFNTEDITFPDLRMGSTHSQPVGLPVLNLSGDIAREVTASVVESDYFEATSISYPSLGPDAVSQISFQLEPKTAWTEADQTIPVTLRIESCSLEQAYEIELELKTVSAEATFRRTFRSPVDGSTQYYGVVPPSNYAEGAQYAMVLSLHGASVKGIGQARAYEPKDWTYIIAPTNRRRFGFDWEEWGRLNGLASLDDAMGSFNIDETRVHVTGHSMGGHGTWHFGVMNTGRFATVSPSAGWGSFYTYTGADRPSGHVARARAHSDTHEYLPNLANRGMYIIHGGNDNNVPTQEGRDMRDAVQQHADDVVYYEEPGAAHWWNYDDTPGADCVDWGPLFTFMQEHLLDPNELDFEWRTPGPYYAAEHSYVTIRSANTPMQDATLSSLATDASTVELATTNVRAMDIDGAALTDKGITDIVVDGTSMEVPDGPLEIGPREGKDLGHTGPLNQVFQSPFCFVYPNPDANPRPYRQYAAYLQSVWSFIGNGHACALPIWQVDDELRAERNLVYLGVPFEDIPDADNRPFSWTDDHVSIGTSDFAESAAMVVFPEGDRLAAAFVATAGSEDLLYRYQPFSSRAGMPDYLVWGPSGGRSLGFFANDWGFDAGLGVGH